MFGGLFLGGPFRPRLASGPVLPAFALSVRGNLAARVRFGAHLARCLFAGRARGALNRPAPATAPGARPLAGWRAPFLFGFGAFGPLYRALGETLLLFVLLGQRRLGAVWPLSLGAPFGMPPAPPAPRALAARFAFPFGRRRGGGGGG